MKRRLLLIAFLISFAAPFAHAQNNAVRVMASNGVQAVITELRPQIEKAMGRPLNIDFNTSAAVRQRVQAGESFDAALVTAEVIDELIKEGKLTPAGRAEVARSGIGFGIKAGSKKPDVSTPDAVKRTLLNAKSITYVPEGASRVHIERMFADLGITNEMKPKTIPSKSADESTSITAEGKTELVLTLISEIVPVRGLDLVGPFPPKYQNYVRFAIGLSTTTKNADAIKAFTQFLSGPGVEAAFKSKGLERPR
jgi:molybdate transport system substrate-binding protein